MPSSEEGTWKASVTTPNPQPAPPTPGRKPSRKTFYNVWWGCWNVVLQKLMVSRGDASGHGWRGGERLNLWELDHVPLSVWITQIGFVFPLFFYFFNFCWSGEGQDREENMEWLGSECDRDAWCEISEELGKALCWKKIFRTCIWVKSYDICLSVWGLFHLT